MFNCHNDIIIIPWYDPVPTAYSGLPGGLQNIFYKLVSLNQIPDEVRPLRIVVNPNRSHPVAMQGNRVESTILMQTEGEKRK